MNIIIKLFITLAVVGFMLICVAAVTQVFNRELADILGSTGFGMWVIDGLAACVWLLVMVWTEKDFNYDL